MNLPFGFWQAAPRLWLQNTTSGFTWFSATAANTTSGYTPKSAYGAEKADESVKTLGYILHCFNCLHRETTRQPFGNLTCPECGSKMDYAGPLWLGSIFDQQFIELMIKENQTVAFKNNARISKLLSLTKQEASAPITYYVLDKLSGKLGLPSPSMQAFFKCAAKRWLQSCANPF